MARLTLFLFFFMVNLSSIFLSRSPAAIRQSSATRLFFNSAADKPVVRPIESLDGFNKVLASGSTDGIVVIKFYASFCRACKTMAPKFRQLASNYKDVPIHFAEIELMANRDLCKALGIKRVPSVHFYHDGNKIEDFVCGPKKIPVLKERLKDYSSNGIAAAMEHSNLLNSAELADTTDISSVYSGSGGGADALTRHRGVVAGSWSQLSDAPQEQKT